jgi:NADPH:quinone reductase-like Zn-dependent oxidoreductase/surfactin synthase thioesterase subunit/SAM-dependent methyltransferase/acyl carrier protein
MFKLLEQGGYCTRVNGGGLKTAKTLPSLKGLDIQKDLEEAFPEFGPELNLLGRCGPQIAGVLQGKVNPVQLIFPEDRWDETVRYYVESYSFSRYNDMVAAAVKTAVDAVAADRCIRVLEIGAGTGGVTQAVLPLFPPDRTEYFYTDLSESFLKSARERFASFSFVEYEILNIETANELPGIYKNSFDIVIASDVIHATKNVADTLTNVRSYMGSGALLVMLEVTKSPVYLDLIFGMTEGWWRYEDEDLRRGHATMEGAKWKAVLEKTGFTGICLKSDFPDNDKSCQNVILAHAPVTNYSEVKPAPVRNQSWLVFEDNKRVAQRIAGKLGTGNADFLFVKPGKAFEINGDSAEINVASRGDFDKLLGSVTTVDAVLFAWAIDTSDNHGIDENALVRDAEKSSLSLMYLFQALNERSSSHAQCPVWMLTQGAQTVKDGEVPHMSQAPFWGTARTIANEFPRIKTSLIDLPETIGGREIDMVVDELSGEDRELEVAFRGRGRYVNILKRIAPAQARRAAERDIPVERQQWVLDLDDFGSLDSATLRISRRRECADDEVEIRVDASALNFRDVMVAMGLLSDEAVNGGLYGKSLGLECAGKVTRIGRGVKKFKPGGSVFGFARHSIGGYTYAKECHVLKADGALSMREHAGLPIVYLTAYYSIVHLCRLQPGEKILVHSAAGGVGIAAVQIAKALGAEVYATAGSDEKREYLRSFGVTNTYDSRSLRFREEILNDTQGYGVDVVINALSGHAIFKGLSCLAPFGRFVEIGKSDIYNNSSLGMKNFGDNISFFVVDVDRMLKQKLELSGKVFEEAMAFFREKGLLPHPVKIFPVGKIKDALRYMAAGKHIGKVILSCEGNAVLSPPRAILFEKDASYLISGGCSGFGLAVARWMSRKGAETLVLVGRRGVRTDEDRAIVEEMQHNGTMVFVEKCDIADAKKMEALGRKIREKYPPLKGVHHCAMVLADTPVSLMDREKFMTAFIPKAVGAWNLHTMTKVLALDFFVNHSSISSIFGNPGQANYAAGNCFLDELAGFRRSLGLPCITINWGILGGTGFVSRTESIKNHLAKQGWYAFSLEESLGILEEMLLLAPRRRTAISADWSKIVELYPHVYETSRFGELTRSSGHPADGGGASGGDVRDAIVKAPENERFEMLSRHLKKAICGILGIASNKIDEKESITRLGLDSLMANEIRTLIDRDLGVEYSLMQIMKGPSLNELCGQLLDSMSYQTNSALQSEEKTDFDRWVLRDVSPKQPSLRIFCFPYFAGGASVFSSWQGLLGEEVEVCRVQLPGREERAGEAVIDDINVLVKRIAEIIRPLLQDLPFAFYGHSMGALIAFELEKFVEKEYGLQARRLIAGAWKAPQVHNPFSVLEKVSVEDIYNKENANLIVGHMRSLGIPEEVLQNASLIEEMLPALQADIVMGKRYRDDGKAIKCPIIAIGGETDTIFRMEQLKPWEEKTQSGFRLETVGGGHLFIRDNKEAFLPVLKEIVQNG